MSTFFFLQEMLTYSIIFFFVEFYSIIFNPTKLDKLFFKRVWKNIFVEKKKNIFLWNKNVSIVV